MNSYAPTKARAMPTKNERQSSFSATNDKARLHQLNIPTACPPHAAVPVHQGLGLASLFQLSAPGSLSVRDATAPAMSPKFGSPSKAVKAFQPSRPTAIKSLGLRRNEPKIVIISRICRFCGRARPSFQAFTTDVAIPILSAR